MEYPISFSGTNPSKVRRLFKNLCIVGVRHAEEHYTHELGIQPENGETEIERVLRARIRQLEEDLLKISEERDAAVEENRRSINELNEKLKSMKSIIKGMITEKQRRVSHLEKKIKRTIK